MIKPSMPFVMVAIAIAVSGSSCHDYGKSDSSANTPQSQSPEASHNSRVIVPRQQIEPQIQPRPRM
ncbi:hypothetical protein PS691_04086 [Pseudomonas fluorescens]|uniref:Lipoprotein n=1 Tax=Pseudomonas fluorescens TaxID=294 RepID=A0A5E7E426_PSEFL|nr:hypothetical protein PS691_04086 [Pseudomonas fluorescens]